MLKARSVIGKGRIEFDALLGVDLAHSFLAEIKDNDRQRSVLALPGAMLKPAAPIWPGPAVVPWPMNLEGQTAQNKSMTECYE